MRTLLLLSALLAATPAFAQPTVGPASPERDRGWLTLGLGASDPYGLAAVVRANFGRERVLQVGYHAELISSILSNVALSSAHVGVGRSRVGRWSRTALTAGPALVWGDRRGDRGFVAIGAVLNGQAIFTPIPELGVGLDAYANLNTVRSSVGLAVTFVFEANK